MKSAVANDDSLIVHTISNQLADRAVSTTTSTGASSSIYSSKSGVSPTSPKSRPPGVTHLATVSFKAAPLER